MAPVKQDRHHVRVNRQDAHLVWSGRPCLDFQAGRLAYESGRMPKKLYAGASSPLAGGGEPARARLTWSVAHSSKNHARKKCGSVVRSRENWNSLPGTCALLL